SSDNPGLIPNSGAPGGGGLAVDYTSPNGTGTLSYTPVANASGTATITVTVADGSGGTVSRSFRVSVTPAVTPPQPGGHPVGVNSRKGLTAITLPFNEALTPGSASNPSLYSVLGAVKKKGKAVYSKKVAIKTVGVSSDGHSVTLNLKTPFKG